MDGPRLFMDEKPRLRGVFGCVCVHVCVCGRQRETETTKRGRGEGGGSQKREAGEFEVRRCPNLDLRSMSFGTGRGGQGWGGCLTGL